MNRILSRTAAATLVLAAAFTAQAQTAAADNAPKTRQQVLAELAQAQRDGQLLSAGELALTQAELAPARYQAAATSGGLTRADVRAETARAMRNGELLAAGEQDASAALPQAAAVASAKTRAQVKAEYAEARRTGDLLVAGESGQTLREQSPQRYRDLVNPAADTTLAGRSTPAAR